jgi:UDP-glucose 4-epimerase
MKVLVTGGAGFIGSALSERLLRRGDEVTVFDNFSSGRKEFIGHLLKSDRFKLIEGDLLDPEGLAPALRRQEMVFHLAANPDIRGSLEEPALDFEQGTVATFNLLEAMRKNKVVKIAFASSSVVYGEPEISPTPEDYGSHLPISLYGASKLAGEGMISSYCHCFGFRAWIFRFANVVGPHPTHGILFDFVKKIRKNPRRLEVLGDGRQKKSYLYVDDCVEGMLWGVSRSGESLNVFNLGGGDDIRISEIARIFLAEASPEAEIVYAGGERGWPGDVPRMLLDVSKINRLGWKARLNSEAAVRLAIKTLLNQPQD